MSVQRLHTLTLHTSLMSFEVWHSSFLEMSKIDQGGSEKKKYLRNEVLLEKAHSQNEMIATIKEKAGKFLVMQIM